MSRGLFLIINSNQDAIGTGMLFNDQACVIVWDDGTIQVLSVDGYMQEINKPDVDVVWLYHQEVDGAGSYSDYREKFGDD